MPGGGMFKVVFFLMFVLSILAFAGQVWFGSTLYEECLKEGKSKAKCIRDLNREMQGKGHNLTIENE